MSLTEISRNESTALLSWTQMLAESAKSLNFRTHRQKVYSIEVEERSSKIEETKKIARLILFPSNVTVFILRIC